jgi:hypothetical protein
MASKPVAICPVKIIVGYREYDTSKLDMETSSSFGIVKRLYPVIVDINTLQVETHRPSLPDSARKKLVPTEIEIDKADDFCFYHEDGNAVMSRDTRHETKSTNVTEDGPRLSDTLVILNNPPRLIRTNRDTNKVEMMFRLKICLSSCSWQTLNDEVNLVIDSRTSCDDGSTTYRLLSRSECIIHLDDLTIHPDDSIEVRNVSYITVNWGGSISKWRMIRTIDGRYVFVCYGYHTVHLSVISYSSKGLEIIGETCIRQPMSGRVLMEQPKSKADLYPLTSMFEEATFLPSDLITLSLTYLLGEFRHPQ